jgi:hypothetical protein
MQAPSSQLRIRPKREDSIKLSRFFMPSKSFFHISNEVGTSLLENLLATAIVGIGLAGFAALSGNLSIIGDKNSQKSIAITIAQDKVEEIKNLSSKIELPGSINSPVYSGDAWSETQGENVDSEGLLNTPEAEYQRSWIITQEPERERLFNLRVNVSYIDRSSNTQTLTVDTRISQNKQVAIVDIIELPETPDEELVEIDEQGFEDPANNIVAGKGKRELPETPDEELVKIDEQGFEDPANNIVAGKGKRKYANGY